ncbi:MAG TPA: DnaD domain protein [Candidatus Tetragenococcus pullicola]|nr:DnaD domain protein [Candidatus Tetragenococcus pullicola]
MRSTWDEVQPNQIYQVFKKLPLTQEGNEGLIYLYQPIIGSQALALYFGFLGDANDSYENEFVHLDMLDALNIGLPAFLEARKKLEAMGLLRVFVKQDSEFGKMFLYQLEEPIHPQNFFKDITYSFLLENVVGERKFRQLKERFKPSKIDTSSYKEVTSKFREVYGNLDERRFSQKMPELDQIAHSFQEEQETDLPIDQEELDWTFLNSLAEKKFIASDNFTESFKKQLVLYHDLYGYDELTLVELMSEVVQLDNGIVDEKQLNSCILEKNKIKRTKKEKFQDNEKNLNKERRFNSLLQNGFSNADVELIEMSEETAPYIFLEAIKEEKHSYVADSETWVLKSLVEKSPLPNSVINVLLHYVLVIQNNSTLADKFINKIATDWSEKQIKSPEAAISHVRKLVKEAKESKKMPAWNKNNGRNRPIRKETLPDWVDQPQVDIEDKDKQVAINKRLKKYIKYKEGE